LFSCLFLVHIEPQAPAEDISVAEHPRRVLRRIPPDPVQFQVILGSLLGDCRLVGRSGERRLRVAHGTRRRDYVRWKYDRLGPFAAGAPKANGDVMEFETVVHPLFDDLARLLANPHSRHEAITRLLRPLGLAVWLADVGRLELRADEFLPPQRALAVAS
jgi:LAGLIDADG DNA endonuclease family protein